MPESGTALFNVCPSASHLLDYCWITQTALALPEQLGGQRMALVFEHRKDKDQMTLSNVKTSTQISRKWRIFFWTLWHNGKQ